MIDFIDNATLEIVNAAQNNIEKGDEGNPLAVVSNWITGRKNTKSTDMERMEKQYAINHIRRHMPAVTDREIEEAFNSSNDFHKFLVAIL